MYTKDNHIETLKEKEMLAFWNKQIQNSIKNDTWNFLFKTIQLNAGNEFLF